MKTKAFLLLSFAVVIGACGSDTATSQADAIATGVRVVSIDDAAAIHESPPRDLVVLDVRTLEEYQQGHLEGAVMIDFYRDDFATRIAELDRDAPYLLYCRSGNRSGRTRELMESLGFTNVADVDGGILSWAEAGQPVVFD